MFILFITLTILAALFLILVVLAQNPKGGGLSGTFGGSGGQLIGVKKTTDIMEKLTWGLAIAVLAFSLMSSFLLSSGRPEGAVSPNIREAEDQQNMLPNMEQFQIPTDTQEDLQNQLQPEVSEPAGEAETETETE